MSIQRVFASILTDQLEPSRRFWCDVLGFEPTFSSNWFVHLAAPGDATLELALLLRDHETVPPRFRAAPRGGLITVVVDDVERVHAEAVRRQIEIVEPPTDMFYGMRRMLLVDPNGQLVDVSSMREGGSDTQVDV